MEYPFFFYWIKYFIAQHKTGEIQKSLGLEPSLSKAFITDKGRIEMGTSLDQDSKEKETFTKDLDKYKISSDMDLIL